MKFLDCNSSNTAPATVAANKFLMLKHRHLFRVIDPHQKKALRGSRETGHGTVFRLNDAAKLAD